MARRRGSSSHRSRERETIDFAIEDAPTQQRVTRNRPRPIIQERRPRVLRPIEDRREYHPLGVKRAARSIQKAFHRLQAPPLHLPRQNRRITSGAPKPGKRLAERVVHNLQFVNPNNVLICIRRKIKREVLFALRKTGAGARARKHKRNEYSEVTCGAR